MKRTSSFSIPLDGGVSRKCNDESGPDFTRLVTTSESDSSFRVRKIVTVCGGKILPTAYSSQFRPSHRGLTPPARQPPTTFPQFRKGPCPGPHSPWPHPDSCRHPVERPKSVRGPF